MIGGRIDVDFGPLDALTGQAQNKGITGAIRRGVQRAAKTARAATIAAAARIKRRGNLSRAIGNKLKLYPKTRSFVLVIGARSKYKRKGPKRTRGKFKGTRPDIRPSRYVGIVEKGSKRTRPKPFLKPVHERYKDDFIKNVIQEVQAEINKLSKPATT